MEGSLLGGGVCEQYSHVLYTAICALKNECHMLHVVHIYSVALGWLKSYDRDASGMARCVLLTGHGIGAHS